MLFENSDLLFFEDVAIKPILMYFIKTLLLKLLNNPVNNVEFDLLKFVNFSLRPP